MNHISKPDGQLHKKGFVNEVVACDTPCVSVTNVDDAANVPAEQRVSEQRHSICCATKFGLHILLYIQLITIKL
jgi:hypothetical protein